MSDISRIKDRIVALKAQKAALDTELEELAITERVLLRLGSLAEGVEVQLTVRSYDAKMPRPGTTRSLFLKVLEKNEPPWMLANDVRFRASEIKGADIPMGTVSPTLTDLKNAGLIVRDGMRVALASRVRGNNEAPAETEASKSSDSGVESLFRETAAHDR